MKIIPYTSQPPSGKTPAVGLPINRGLVYATAIPYEAGWGRAVGVKAASYPGNVPTYSQTGFLGKTVVTTTAAKPVEFTGFNYVAPPFSVMLNFRQNSSQASSNYIISFGGSGSASGWALALNTGAAISVGGVGVYTFTLPVALAPNIDYTVVLTVVGTTATIWYCAKDDRNEGVQTASVTIGSIVTPTKPLTLGAFYDGGSASYSGGFDGHIGAFALWNRGLARSEIYSLIYRPYQIWGYAVSGIDPIYSVHALPDTSSIGISTSTPVVIVPSTVSPAVSSLNLFGAAPSISVASNAANPSTQLLDLVGSAPSIAVSNTTSPQALVRFAIISPQIRGALFGNRSPGVELLSDVVSSDDYGRNIQVPEKALLLDTSTPSTALSSAPITQVLGEFGVAFPQLRGLLFGSRLPGVERLVDVSVSDTFNQTTQVPKGSLLSGTNAPAILLKSGFLPAKGTLTLSSSAPGISIRTARLPAIGELNLAASTPKRITTHRQLPSAGSAVLATSTPVNLVKIIKSPAVAAISLSVSTPSKLHSHRALPDTKNVLLVSSTPAKSENISKTPSPGSVVSSALAPKQITSHAQLPDVGGIVVSGNAPSLRYRHPFFPATVDCAIVSGTPTWVIDAPALPQNTLLTLDTSSVSLITGHVVKPDVPNLSIATTLPICKVVAKVSPASGTLGFTASTPVNNQHSYIATGHGAISFSGLTPLKVDNLDSLVLISSNPTLRIGRVAVPASANLIATAETPTLKSSVRVSPDSGSLSVGPYAPNIGVTFSTPIFQSSTSSSDSVAVSLSLSVPLTTVNGHLMVMAVAWAGTQTITDPGGWNLIRNSSSGLPSESSSNLATYWRIADNESVNYSIVFSAITKAAGTIWDIANSRGVLPVDSSSMNSGTGSALTAAGISTVTPNTLLLHFASNFDSTTDGYTAPANFTQTTSLRAAEEGLEGSYLYKLDAGATGDVTATANNSGSSSNYTAQLIAIAAGHIAVPLSNAVPLVGLQPVANVNLIAFPTVGEIAVSVNTPAISFSDLVYPGEQSLLLETTTPLVSLGDLYSPGGYELVAAGINPELGVSYTLSPVAGVIDLVGNTPLSATDKQFAVPTTNIVLGVSNPNKSVFVAGTLPTAELLLSGNAPTTSQQVRKYPDVGAISSESTTPVVGFSYKISVDTCVTTVTTSAPTNVVNVSDRPDAGIITLSASTPTVYRELFSVPNVSALALEFSAPNYFVENIVPVGSAAVSLEGGIPALQVFYVDSPDTCSVYVLPSSPTIRTTGESNPDTGQVELLGDTPTVFVESIFLPDVVDSYFVGNTPKVNINNRSLPIESGSIEVTGSTPSLLISFRFLTDSAGVSLTPGTPTTKVSLSVPVGVGAITFTGRSPDVISEIVTTVSTTALAFSGGEVSPLVVSKRYPATFAMGLSGTQPDARLRLIVPVDVARLNIDGGVYATKFDLVVSPDVGGVSFSYSTPSLFEKVFRAPAQKDLVATGLAPTVGVSYVISLPKGELDFSGSVYTTVLYRVISPAQAEASFTGIAPNNGISYTLLTPSAELITSSDNADKLVTIPANPITGALSLAGGAVALDVSYKFSASVAALSYDSSTPATRIGKLVLPTTVDTTLIGGTPSLEGTHTIVCTTGGLLVSGGLPTYRVGNIGDTPTYEATLSSGTPFISFRYKLSVADPEQQSITTYAPVNSVGIYRASQSGSIQLSGGNAPVISVKQTISIEAGSSQFEYSSASVVINNGFRPTTSELALSSTSPSVGISYNISPSTRHLFLPLDRPVVTASADYVCSIPAAGLSCSGIVPVSVIGNVALPDTFVAEITGSTPELEGARTIVCSTGQIVVSGNAPNRSVSGDIDTSTYAATLVPSSPSISFRYTISVADPEEQTITTYAPVNSVGVYSFLQAGLATFEYTSPVISIAGNLQTGTGSIQISSDSTATLINRRFFPPTTGMALTATAPSVGISYSFTPSTKDLYLPLDRPVVLTSADHKASVPTADLSFNSDAGITALGNWFYPDSYSVGISGGTPELAGAVAITCGTGQISVSSSPPKSRVADASSTPTYEIDIVSGTPFISFTYKLSVSDPEEQVITPSAPTSSVGIYRSSQSGFVQVDGAAPVVSIARNVSVDPSSLQIATDSSSIVINRCFAPATANLLLDTTTVVVGTSYKFLPPTKDLYLPLDRPVAATGYVSTPQTSSVDFASDPVVAGATYRIDVSGEVLSISGNPPTLAEYTQYRYDVGNADIAINLGTPSIRLGHRYLPPSCDLGILGNIPRHTLGVQFAPNTYSASIFGNSGIAQVSYKINISEINVGFVANAPSSHPGPGFSPSSLFMFF